MLAYIFAYVYSRFFFFLFFVKYLVAATGNREYTKNNKIKRNQLLQLCTARTGFPILVSAWLYTVMPEVCHWLTNERQKKTDIHSTDQ